ncbi:ABC-type lipoprotein export system ATPase subunit [Dysgonomonas alginatilytica]|uniref:ABC-type lipoprotein export system ATPase subunit n=1 Tax=Dysgonomonas alginatilytica TaxID=1605892 RepID=A0A2V3PPL6_9BACT|nr:ATP-binding cassette domain-containing protein [Dysgonomonas alginatilytica]PXV62823.1 ABC-type lipoprotein export system ATPase subunit [Dysgonomonas alginatilytica]
MDKIIFRNTLPLIFSDEKGLQSDVWLQDFSFEKGKSYLIEANSGTGKSSLCSYIYGYRDDYSGDIIFNNVNIRRFKARHWDKVRNTEISLLFQELCLFPELTALENVQLKNNLTGYKESRQIHEMFDLLGIANKKDSPVAKMSWGQQQRVALIRCLCQPFDFLVLDEPISHLDDENASTVAILLQREAWQQGAGIVATSIGKHLPLEYTKTFAL